MVFEADVALEGPDEVPLTELAFSRGVRVPSPQDETVIVNVIPEEEEGVKTHALDVPAFSKSPLSRDVIDSLIVNVYVIEERVFVGVTCELTKLDTAVDGYEITTEPFPEFPPAVVVGAVEK